MKDKSILGEKIAFYRNELRLKRPAFIDLLNKASGSNYTSQALYSWETGKAIPPADLIPSLAKTLKINILQLFGEDKFEESSVLLEKISSLQKEVELLKAEVDELRSENYRLEGKLEASKSILQEMIASYKRP